MWCIAALVAWGMGQCYGDRMSRAVEKIVEEIHSLSASEKEELLHALIVELDSGHDPEIDAAWLAEAQRRGQEIDDGTVECVPASEVFERLRSALKKK
jgi:putative addiction module component (TIGR02574 family)